MIILKVELCLDQMLPWLLYSRSFSLQLRHYDFCGSCSCYDPKFFDRQVWANSEVSSNLHYLLFYLHHSALSLNFRVFMVKLVGVCECFQPSRGTLRMLTVKGITST